MVPRDARCLGCGYSLRGLAEPRCPECGRPFDPADPTSVRLPARRRPRREPAVVHAAGDVGLIALGLTTVGRWDGATAAADLGWLIWVLLAVLLVGQRLVGLLDWVTGPSSPAAAAAARTSRRWAARCLVLAVVLNLSAASGACPHSRWFVAGPIGLMYSPDGPCRNRRAPSVVAGPSHGWYLVGPATSW